MKFFDVAVGWLNKKEDGSEFVSAMVSKGNPAKGKPGFTIIVKTDDGQEFAMDKFRMTFNENKQEGSKAPDVKFTVMVAD